MFEFAQTVGPLANLGSATVLIGYVVWRQSRDDRVADKDRESREKLAVALALLTEAIKGGR